MMNRMMGYSLPPLSGPLNVATKTSADSQLLEPSPRRTASPGTPASRKEERRLPELAHQ